MKKTNWVLIIFSMVLIIFLPIAMDWFIIGNEVHSNISNSDWVSFLGSYIGSILGAIFGFAGIIFTIRYTREENRSDRELQIKPYFDIKYDITKKIIKPSYSIGEISYGCGEYTNFHSDEVSGLIVMKNVGLGSAINCRINVEKIDDNRNHFPILLTSPEHGYYKSILPNENGSITLNVAFNFDKIQEEDFDENGEIKSSTISKYKNHTIVINFCYEDILYNKYSQIITLGVQIYSFKKSDTEDYKYEADIYLKEVGKAIKIKS